MTSDDKIREKNCNMILTVLLSGKMINMNISQVKKYYLLIEEK